MAALFSPGTTDVAGQVAIEQGVDSNVFQTTNAAGETVRNPAAFTTVEASVGLLARGRVTGDGSDLRAFGRFLTYEPLGEHFESKAARGGLSYIGSLRLDRQTTLVTTLLGSVGSLQASRGTDGTFTTVDPVSTRRSAWNASGAETFVTELSERTSLHLLSGVDLAGTLAETVPGQDTTVDRGLDFLVVRARGSVLRRLDRLTSVDTALMVERTHTAYTLVGGDPAGQSLGGIDGGALTATVTLSRLLSPETTASGALGATFAIPRFGDTGTVLPLASAGLIHAEAAWSMSALAAFQYGLAQPRLGPGGTTNLSITLVGKPLEGRARDTLELVAEASGQHTGVIVGVNDGSSVVTGGGSLTMRVFVGGGLGLLVGYDGRATRFDAGGDASATWYVHHVGFVGLSWAWIGTGVVSPMPTLARPAAAPFVPT